MRVFVPALSVRAHIARPVPILLPHRGSTTEYRRSAERRYSVVDPRCGNKIGTGRAICARTDKAGTKTRISSSEQDRCYKAEITSSAAHRFLPSGIRFQRGDPYLRSHG